MEFDVHFTEEGSRFSIGKICYPKNYFNHEIMVLDIE